MGYQERRAKQIAAQAAPHLEPGEQIQTGFLAVTGGAIFNTGWWVVVTDRAILVVRRGQSVRVPRDVVFGEPKGVYHPIVLDQRYRVHRQFYQELVAADEALRQMRAGDNPAQ
ncbi:hypothetical protein BWI15_08400 [Kribbella sp. ALI-6-A]|uniref:hypothetical protein n=1 Tax=Kribbella sp. ALI-6-A TaxID=1933817 RepID=UPI00097C9F53|nr:hypothetical protein [Kribbella sp. ALI-6-A]ONI75823.1 hypothetical protein BWI15_08400 [Kribbella sp. ALI-6-A]